MIRCEVLDCVGVVGFCEYGDESLASSKPRKFLRGYYLIVSYSTKTLCYLSMLVIISSLSSPYYWVCPRRLGLGIVAGIVEHEA